MMTGVILFVAIVAAAFLQVALPVPSLLGGIKWPLLQAVVVYYALQRETQIMLIAAALGGFMQDALSPIPLGASTVVFALTGWGVSHFRSVVMTEAAITQGFFGMMAAGAGALVLYVFLRATGELELPVGQGAHKIAGAAIEGLLCSPLVFKALEELDRAVGNTRTASEVEGEGSELDGTAE